MKLIIGIGNPGEEYEKNRHNVGYLLVDELKNKIAGLETVRTKEKRGVIVKKSDVFMNNSGEFVKKLIDQYRVKLANLRIIHDDLDIRLGDYKIQFGKGPKNHNGILSIENKLGSKDFWRVRIGVDNRDPENRISGEGYVLQDFTEEELVILKKVAEEVGTELFQ